MLLILERHELTVNEIRSVTVDNPSNPTDPATVVYTDAVPTSTSGSYTQALPSLNLTYRWLC